MPALILDHGGQTILLWILGQLSIVYLHGIDFLFGSPLMVLVYGELSL